MNNLLVTHSSSTFYLSLYHVLLVTSYYQIHPVSSLFCEDLNKIFDTKGNYIAKLNEKLKDKENLINFDKSNPFDEDRYQMEVLSLVRNHLDIGESLITASIKSFRHTMIELSSNVKSVLLLKELSENRLSILRDHILACEAEVVGIDQFFKLIESHHKANNLIQSQHLSEQLLGELFLSADQLEVELHHDLFQRYKQSHAVETVIKIGGGETSNEFEQSMYYIIDTKNDRYVLNRPDDPTISREDMLFVTDIFLILICSSLLSLLFLTLGIPHLLGAILSGIILGPSGIDILTSLVQIETLGEFGIFFILFTLGLQFSPDNIRKVWHESFLASNLITFLFILMGCILSVALGLPIGEIVFIFAAFSLSSTPLVMRLFQEDNYNSQHVSPIKDTLLGILILQDIQFSCFMAVMPLLLSIKSYGSGKLIIVLIAKCCFVCFLLLFVIKFVNKVLMESIIRRLHRKDHQVDALMFYSLFFCFAFSLLSHSIGISTEIICLLCGLGMSFNKNIIADRLKYNFESLMQFFSIFFFSSVGFHIFPTFVLHKLTLILIFSSLLFVFKFLVFLLVKYLIFYKSKNLERSDLFDSRALLAMSSISELVLLLGTRARRMHFISREIHLLMLSSTSLVLFTVPILYWAKSILTRKNFIFI